LNYVMGPRPNPPVQGSVWGLTWRQSNMGALREKKKAKRAKNKQKDKRKQGKTSKRDSIRLYFKRGAEDLIRGNYPRESTRDAGKQRRNSLPAAIGRSIMKDRKGNREEGSEA